MDEHNSKRKEMDEQGPTNRSSRVREPNRASLVRETASVFELITALEDIEKTCHIIRVRMSPQDKEELEQSLQTIRNYIFEFRKNESTSYEHIQQRNKQYQIIQDQIQNLSQKVTTLQKIPFQSSYTRKKTFFVPIPEKLQYEFIQKHPTNPTKPINKHQAEEQHIKESVNRYLPFFQNLSSNVHSPETPTLSQMKENEVKVDLLDQLYSFSNSDSPFGVNSYSSNSRVSGKNEKMIPEESKLQKISSSIIELSRVEHEAKRVGLDATTLNKAHTIQQLTKKRINEIKEHEKNYIQTADICFLVDLSYFMNNWKDQVITTVKLMIVEILQRYTHRYKVNYSFVGYYEQSTDNCLVFPFTDDAPSFLEFLSSLPCSEGIVLSSNLNGGLKEVVELEWSSSLRLLYFLPVSICCSLDETYLDSNNVKSDLLTKHLKQIMELRIRLYYTEITPETDYILENFMNINRDINSQYSIESLTLYELPGFISKIFGAYVPPVVVPKSPVFVTHVIFVIDTSGSMSLSLGNEDDFIDPSDFPDLDYEGVIDEYIKNSSPKSRLSAVFDSCVEFVKQQFQQPNTANDCYSMILFNEATIVPMSNFKLTPDLPEIIYCIKDSAQPKSGTVYSIALDEVCRLGTMIESDLMCVIFLSDGLPEDKPVTIERSITKLIDNFGLNIQLNTLQIDDSKESNEILEAMAQQGRGVFLKKNLTADLIRDGFVAVAENLTNTRAKIDEVQNNPISLQPRPFIIVETIPNFNYIENEPALVFSMALPKTIEELDLMVLDKTESSIKQALHPFSKGTQRLAYYMCDMKFPKLMVKKTFLLESPDPKGEFLSFLEELEIQATSKFLAEKFNQVTGLSKKINFVETFIYKPSAMENFLFSGEEFMDGSYTRYTNNYGYVANEPDIDIIVAFAHWTYEITNETLMVVDLQGVGLSLTDPAIHCVHLFRYGKTNFGRFGMAKFFQTHTCNSICKHLRLPKREFTEEQIKEWELVVL